MEVDLEPSPVRRIGSARPIPEDESAAPASPVHVARRLGVMAAAAVVTTLALAGFLSVTRGTPLERVSAEGGPSAIPAVGDPLFARSMELYTDTPLTEGNAVELLTNGDGTYPPLWADLRGATRSINVQLYFSQPSAVADTIAAVLAERARAGVTVRVLLDAFGSQNLKGSWADSLRAAGAEVAFLRRMRWYKLDRITSRSHVRAIVIDGRVGYGGGFGLADYWLGGGRRDDEWRETNVRFRGPSVVQAQGAFGVAWTEATGELLTGERFFTAAGAGSGAGDSAGRARAAFMLTRPSKGSTTAERFTALSIAGARRTLYVTSSYFIPDDDFRRLLRGAARRGRACRHREHEDGHHVRVLREPVDLRGAARRRGAHL